jgi:hypothetical protein
VFIPCLWSFVLPPASARAQAPAPCDPEILRNAAQGQNHAYQERDGERCEGIYASDVSGTELWLASLTESFDPFEFNYEPLRISWKGAADRDLRIRAVGTEAGMYYRMDRVQPPGTNQWDWDSELLAVREIGRDRLGLLAWRETSPEPLFIPLRVTQERSDRPWSGSYTVLVMPQVSLGTVFVTLARVDAPGDLPMGELIRDQQPLEQSLFLPRRPFEVVLDDVREPGVYYVRITGQQRSGASAEMEPFWFRHLTP